MAHNFVANLQRVQFDPIVYAFNRLVINSRSS